MLDKVKSMSLPDKNAVVLVTDVPDKSIPVVKDVYVVDPV